MEIILEGDNLDSLNMVQVIDYIWQYMFPSVEAACAALDSIRVTGKGTSFKAVNINDDSELLVVTNLGDDNYSIKAGENAKS
jgi:hypothetical protein